jgi:hypothetical protein
MQPALMLPTGFRLMASIDEDEPSALSLVIGCWRIYEALTSGESAGNAGQGLAGPHRYVTALPFDH